MANSHASPVICTPTHRITRLERAMITSVESKHPQLALLIGAPHDGDLSMHNDLVAMYDALRMRGLAPEEVLTLEGKLDRQILMGFLKGVSRRIAKWARGELFLYFSGHGFFTGDTVEEARVGVQLQSAAQEDSEYCTYWDEIFATLSVPEGVIFTILPDH